MNSIAADFPVLNNGCAYLDNAATTHSPKAVVDAMVCYYSSSHSNVHSGLHDLSEKATKLYNDSRKTIADFINADDIVLYRPRVTGFTSSSIASGGRFFSFSGK